MRTHRIGVISDTHGLLRPEAIEALRGCDLIVHAGDVGKPGIVERLSEIAPVCAVRGNVDRGAWAGALPATQIVEVNGLLLYVLHDVHELDLDAATAGIRAVISGHSHRASIEWREGVLYLNPGAAGPRRFRLPVTLARVEVQDESLNPQIVQIESA